MFNPFVETLSVDHDATEEQTGKWNASRVTSMTDRQDLDLSVWTNLLTKARDAAEPHSGLLVSPAFWAGIPLLHLV